MKIRIFSNGVTGTGEAPDDAPSMDPDFARVMLGCVCYEVLPDGSQGRSIDPQWVRTSGAWVVDSDAIRKRLAADEAAEWIAAFAPCEALASRDPGRAS